MTGYNTEDVAETSGELPEKVRLAYVAPRFLDVWRIAPALGRGFTAADHRDGAPLVAVMSDRLLANPFRCRSGRARSHAPPRQSAVCHRRRDARLVPVSRSRRGRLASSDLTTDSRNRDWQPGTLGVGRLKPGISLTEARADLDVVQRQLAAEHADTDSRIGARIEPFKETMVGGIRGSLWLLFGAVSLLLLIACTNIAALLLARGVQRQRRDRRSRFRSARRGCRLQRRSSPKPRFSLLPGRSRACWWLPAHPRRSATSRQVCPERTK